MADLGAIGKRTLYAVESAQQITPSAANVYQSRRGVGAVTTVSGTVTQGAVAAARIVRVYDRNSGSLLGQTTSNASTGAFSVGISGTAPVFAIAFDNTGTPYNAVVADLVVPA